MMNLLKNLFKKPGVHVTPETEGNMINKSNEFTFNLVNPKPEEIEFCEESESVGFWKHPEKDEVWVYRKGTAGGDGLLGFVPAKFKISIINYLIIEGEFITEIKQVLKTNLLIYCRLVSVEETNNRINKQNERLLESLKKNYITKTEFLFRMDKDYDCTITKKNYVVT